MRADVMPDDRETLAEPSHRFTARSYKSAQLLLIWPHWPQISLHFRHAMLADPQ
jgi:hypothetical protein